MESLNKELLIYNSVTEQIDEVVDQSLYFPAVRPWMIKSSVTWTKTQIAECLVDEGLKMTE